MWPKRNNPKVEDLEKRLEASEAALNALQDTFETLSDKVMSWELRMEEMHEKTLYAIRRHDKRLQREKRNGGPTGDGEEVPDPTTQKVLARRRSKPHGLFAEPQG